MHVSSCDEHADENACSIFVLRLLCVSGTVTWNGAHCHASTHNYWPICVIHHVPVFTFFSSQAIHDLDDRVNAHLFISKSVKLRTSRNLVLSTEVNVVRSCVWRISSRICSSHWKQVVPNRYNRHSTWSYNHLAACLPRGSSRKPWILARLALEE